MPKRKDIQKVLVIGSGPIVIGQAAEFDYAGSQACRALKEEGARVVLVNSNPATIMTDLSVADTVYIEPMTVSFLAYVLGKERPDGIIPTLGGQLGLNLAAELARTGILTDLGIEILGTPLSAIEQAEDREAFRRLMVHLNHPIPGSQSVTAVEQGLAFAVQAGYPLILRPAYTLGGSGGGFVANDREMLERLPRALALSPIGQVLIEESIAGWKEIEYEVIRDGRGNAISVCNMENVDPVGVHTGDSIVVAPSQTLSNQEYQKLRTVSLQIIDSLRVQGGCNVQLALNRDGDYRVIEVNPRVSRSSALASKATGYPIARIAAKIAIGLSLDEIPNPVTEKTTAAFEPALDYTVVKIPRWPFDKFPDADRELGTQMKATGEVMAIDRTFTGALQKAVRSLEIKQPSLFGAVPAQLSDNEVRQRAIKPTDDRLFYLAEYLRRGGEVGELEQATRIDAWFLHEIARIAAMDSALERDPQSWRENLRALKEEGFADDRIAALAGVEPDQVAAARRKTDVEPAYKMVDTCAGEFPARTPYFYSTYDREDEALALGGERVIVLGSGPIRIGQGIEFDAASVYALKALRARKLQAIMINSNPETVSTDFNESDRLYFEPLTLEDVLNVVAKERPIGVMVQFGGQTAINLAAGLDRHGVKILGTSLAGLTAAEDRRSFDAVLERHQLRRPPGMTATTVGDAKRAAAAIGFPVLVRPSFVLGGRAMRIVDDGDQLEQYLDQLIEIGPDQPLLVDRYLNGLELEVDAVSDGERILIPAVMEHVERAGVHSGDSLAVLPPRRASPALIDEVVRYTETLCRALEVRGLINVQFVAVGESLYVIEANPRSSRTVPFLIKATGIPLVDLAIEAALSGRLPDRYGYGLASPPKHVAVKMPVFSFAKLGKVDAALGPEMKSTGEAMGLDTDVAGALYKALLAGGFRLRAGGKVLATIADADKEEAIPLLRALEAMGYALYATEGTLARLSLAGVPATPVHRIGVRHPDIIDLIGQGTFDLVVDTITRGGRQESEGFLIRRTTVERGIMCLTSLDTLRAAVTALAGRHQKSVAVRSLNEWLNVDVVH